MREQHRRLARARGSSTEAVVGGIANAPPFRNADTNSVVSLPQIDVRKGMPPVKCLGRNSKNAIAAASPTGFLNPYSANSVPSWMPGRPGRAIMTANVAPAWCQKNMSRKRSNFPKVPLIRLASIRRFSRSAITRQLPDQALGDTAQDEARGDIAEPMRKQHNAGQD